MQGESRRDGSEGLAGCEKDERLSTDQDGVWVGQEGSIMYGDIEDQQVNSFVNTYFNQMPNERNTFRGVQVDRTTSQKLMEIVDQ